MNNKQYITSKVLGDYEELLEPHGFIRTQIAPEPEFYLLYQPRGAAVLIDNSTVRNFPPQERRSDEEIALMHPRLQYRLRLSTGGSRLISNRPNLPLTQQIFA